VQSRRHVAETTSSLGDLRGGLFGRDEQDVLVARRQRTQRHQCERGFADAGLAVQERRRATHEAAAEYPIEFTDARGGEDGAFLAHVAQRRRFDVMS